MPYDIALDDEGDIFVMDTGAGRVLQVDNSGKNAGQEIDLGIAALPPRFLPMRAASWPPIRLSMCGERKKPYPSVSIFGLR